jgi:hypothetical protein
LKKHSNIRFEIERVFCYIREIDKKNFVLFLLRNSVRLATLKVKEMFQLLRYSVLQSYGRLLEDNNYVSV